MGVARRGASSDFVLRGCSYNTPTFTYRFANATGDIPGANEQAAIQRAFRTWASALCGVSFQQTTATTANFTVGWFTGAHGDNSAFDGVGNTLAHAFYPPPCGGANAGALHFDDAETWSLSGANQTFDTETVALHEIGHLLGLDHSTVPGAVMFRSYQGVRRQLTQDDIDGIRRLYPALCRQGDSGQQAGFVAEIAVARQNEGRLLTAVRAQNGTLKLIGWRLAADASLTRTADSGNQAGAATSIDIVRSISGSRFITACRTDAGRLMLISWQVADDGTSIQRRGDSGTLAGAASLIRIVTPRSQRWVTACRTGEGDLRVIAWGMQPGDTFTRLADSGTQAGNVTDIDMVALDADRVLTAVRNSAGNLLLIVWRVTDNAVQRLGDSGNQAGSSRLIKVALDPSGHAVTAVKTASDTLKLITWRIQPSGVIQRLGDSGDLAGVTTGHDLAMATDGRMATAVSTESGNLKVILWQTTSSGAVTRWGDSADLAGAATLPTLGQPLGGTIVTAVRAGDSSLKLITWGT